MALEPPSTPAAHPANGRVRLRFQKCGDLRLVSHHDLMKVFERMCRRAALPVASSKGFHPKPRIGFPLSLALGVAGLDEVVEIELESRHDPEAVRDALARQAPPGLHIVSARALEGRGSRVCAIRYRAELPHQHRTGLAERVACLLSGGECWVERSRPQPRRFNLRPLIRDLSLTDGALEMDLWVTPAGTARPEEVLGALGVSADLDSVVLERTAVELDDETPTTGPLPPVCELAGAEAAGPAAAAGGADHSAPRDGADPRRGAGHTPLLPGPLSFDS